MSKLCPKCKQTKSLTSFHKRKGKPTCWCIDCCKRHSAEYRNSHRNSLREKGRLYYRENLQKAQKSRRNYVNSNKEKVAQRKRKYYSKNQDRCNFYQKEYNKLRASKDINFKLKRHLRTRLWHAIKKNFKSGSAVSDLGCTIPELKVYLESKFQLGMMWENWNTNGWHIDHIKPLSSFNLEDREEFLKACHYTNLQPLWAEDNRHKSDMSE